MIDKVEVLQAMKNALMERGWCQHSFETEDGFICLMSSITRTSVCEMYSTPAVNRIIRALKNQAGGMNLITWNDQPGRTFNEVIALIDDTILSEKQRLDV